MSVAIQINEIHPNPTEGSEWIELISEDCLENQCDLTSYQIFDSYHQIYQFDGQEVFTNKLLVIKVSGLNNDQDSVILKDNQDNILDSFSYEKTEKGLSWSKTVNNDFVLSEPSLNLENPTPTPSPTATPTSTLTPTPTSSSPTPSLSPTETKPTNTPNKSTKIKKYHYYNLSQIKLESHDQAQEERMGRLVFLSKSKGQVDILNAIIGSSLFVLSSLWLVYVRFKNHSFKKLFSSLS